jgi:hypothetical protein
MKHGESIVKIRAIITGVTGMVGEGYDKSILESKDMIKLAKS